MRTQVIGFPRKIWLAHRRWWLSMRRRLEEDGQGRGWPYTERYAVNASVSNFVHRSRGRQQLRRRKMSASNLRSNTLGKPSFAVMSLCLTTPSLLHTTLNASNHSKYWAFGYTDVIYYMVVVRLRMKIDLPKGNITSLKSLKLDHLIMPHLTRVSQSHYDDSSTRCNQCNCGNYSHH